MTPADRQRARAVDLIVIPHDVSGTSCGNCSFFAAGHCRNPHVDQPVMAFWCCNLWDHAGVRRVADLP